MNKNTGFLLHIILFTALAAVSCKTAEFGFKVIDLHGMVYDFSNRPVANCEVSLGRKYNSVTDINGRFTLPKVPLGTYTLTASRRGFERYADEVIIRERGQIIYFRIPSQNQLLDLADEALGINDFALAEELVERAYKIDNNNIEMLFYYATVKFRQREHTRAIHLLETAKSLGSKDLFIDKFLTILRGFQNAEILD
jgi:tetratricopeptide (TPR) repeat protein